VRDTQYAVPGYPIPGTGYRVQCKLYYRYSEKVAVVQFGSKPAQYNLYGILVLTYPVPGYFFFQYKSAAQYKLYKGV